MIISTNEWNYLNATNLTSGPLRTTTANELFLGFKPSAVMKKNGFLTVSGSGYVNIREPRATYNLSMEFSKLSHYAFTVPIVAVTDFPVGRANFSFHVDIPVGKDGISENSPAVMTTHFNGVNTVMEVSAFISAKSDEVWIATFKYNAVIETWMAAGDFRIYSIIADYKEN